MQPLESQLESILLYKNEPVSTKELSHLVERSIDEVKAALQTLHDFYNHRGIILASDGEYWSFGTHPTNSSLIEKIRKEEFSTELGRAGLETLAIVLYRGPVSRREIDQIRGVNSGFVLRTLLIRGLIERVGPSTGSGQSSDRSFVYKPTLALYEHLGISRREDLPEYESAWKAVETFVKAEDEKGSKETSDV